MAVWCYFSHHYQYYIIRVTHATGMQCHTIYTFRTVPQTVCTQAVELAGETIVQLAQIVIQYVFLLSTRMKLRGQQDQGLPVVLTVIQKLMELEEWMMWCCCFRLMNTMQRRVVGALGTMHRTVTQMTVTMTEPHCAAHLRMHHPLSTLHLVMRKVSQLGTV